MKNTFPFGIPEPKAEQQPCLFCKIAPMDLFGGDIKKGHPYWESSDKPHCAVPYDPKTGLPDPELEDFYVPIEITKDWEFEL